MLLTNYSFTNHIHIYKYYQAFNNPQRLRSQKTQPNWTASCNKDLTLNNTQGLICHETEMNHSDSFHKKINFAVDINTIPHKVLLVIQYFLDSELFRTRNVYDFAVVLYSPQTCLFLEQAYHPQTGPVGWGCRIHWPHLCSGVRLLQQVYRIWH